MEEFYIDNDGIRLHAKLDRPDGFEKGPLCILIHGFTGDMEEEHIIAAQQAMNDVGVASLRVELYGHGKSDGEFKNHTLYKWVTNALAVVDYARSLDYVTDLYISGHSQGGLLAMLIGGMRPDDFKALLPLSPAWMIPKVARQGEILGVTFDPAHIPEVIVAEGWSERELSGDYIRVAQTIHVEDEIDRYQGPVLIVHGEEDESVPFSYAKIAQERYHDAKLIPVPGADHCFNGHIRELEEAIRDFFK